VIPTEPGYYWRKAYNEDGELVEQVVEVAPMVRTEPSELFYWEPGDIGGVYVQEEKGVEWRGPVNNPFRTNLTPTDMDNIARQWFDSLQDTHPEFLGPLDYTLAMLLYEACGIQLPNRIREGLQIK
jgi:hypothetical protein